MSSPRRIAHVFPYDFRHLGQTFSRWAPSQFERWPLAAVRLSRFAPSSSVHVIGPGRHRFSAPPIEVVEHRALLSGPRWRDVGDDWSIGLGRMLSRLGEDDICVIHFNDYAGARLAHRAARRSRVVIVFHGLGLGTFDEHLESADRLVVLRQNAAEALLAGGARPDQVVVLPPSVDRSRFSADGEAAEGGRDLRLGFVGRLEHSKGVFEIPPVLARLAADGIAARAELAGPFSAWQREQLEDAAARAGVRDRMELLGEIPANEIAERMRAWRLLLLPSFTEGHPLVALEACACRLPVAAVDGVLPAELERRPAVSAAPRERYAELVARLLSEARRPPPDDWVRTHEAAAAEWDAMLEAMPAWSMRRPPRVARVRRARRLRPPRRLARAVLRRHRRAGAAERP
jgi:glycosyltransferase involved in cell wall biosynthesis